MRKAQRQSLSRLLGKSRYINMSHGTLLRNYLDSTVNHGKVVDPDSVADTL